MMVGNVFVNATTTTFLRWVYVIDCSAKKEMVVPVQVHNGGAVLTRFLES